MAPALVKAFGRELYPGLPEQSMNIFHWLRLLGMYQSMIAESGIVYLRHSLALVVVGAIVFRRSLRLGLVIALAVSGCAQVQQRQQLAEPVNVVMRTPVGGTIATVVKDRDLPNVFGRADIYGRTVAAGFTRLVYRGRGSDGSVLVEQIDVDIKSNASTLTRPPIANTPTQPAVLSSRESGVAYGTSRTLRVASPADQVAMPMPGAARFSVPKQTSLTLPTGQTVEFIAAEPHQLIFRIVDGGT